MHYFRVILEIAGDKCYIYKSSKILPAGICIPVASAFPIHVPPIQHVLSIHVLCMHQCFPQKICQALTFVRMYMYIHVHLHNCMYMYIHCKSSIFCVEAN